MTRSACSLLLAVHCTHWDFTSVWRTNSEWPTTGLMQRAVLCCTETNPMNKPPSTVGHAVVSRGKGQGMNEGLRVSGELRQVHGRCRRQPVKMARGHSDERHAALVVVAPQSEKGGRMRTVNFEKKTFSSSSATRPTRTRTRAPVPWLFPAGHRRRRHAAAALPTGRHKRSLCVRPEMNGDLAF